jgi:BlaI family transcriptional regulator, penicillinase repressor
MAINCHIQRVVRPVFNEAGCTMGKKQSPHDLGRRQRQIMDAIFELGEASVAEVRARLADPPSYSSVRTMIRYLEGKGYLRHRREGTKYVYRATTPKESVSRSVLRHTMKTFFGGSVLHTVAALLDVTSDRLSDADFDRIERLIGKARKEGR